jgi:hypothetical protein
VARPAFLQLFAVQRCDLTANLPEAGPIRLRRFGFLGMLGRDIQGLALADVAPGEIQVGAVAAGRAGMTGAVRLPTGAGSSGQATLDHGLSDLFELPEESYPTHIITVG